MILWAEISFRIGNDNSQINKVQLAIWVWINT